MRLSDTVSSVLVGTTVLCAVLSTGLLVRREFLGPRSIARATAAPVFVQNWRAYAAVGHRMGPPTARVTILEFADFECPVCKAFTLGALRYVRSKNPDDIQVVFRHWPLSYHRFAYPTARAAECAAAQGRFEAFHDLVYAKQDSLGLKPYSAFAREANIPDSQAFDKCNTRSGAVAVIDADVRAAATIGAKGTPTLVINGWMSTGAPDSMTLERTIQQALRVPR